VAGSYSRLLYWPLGCDEMNSVVLTIDYRRF